MTAALRFPLILLVGGARIVWGSTAIAAALAVAAVIAANPDGGGFPTPTPTATSTGTPVGCDRSATTGTFSSQLSAATTGQVICLETGNYGTFNGTTKAVTIAAADGASPLMKFCFGSGDTGFTLDGMGGMGGNIGTSGSCSGGATNITIKNSTFTSQVNVENAATDKIVFDHITSDWPASSADGDFGAKFLFSGQVGTVADPTVTIKDSHIANGDLDAVHIGGGSGYIIEGNEMVDLCDQGVNHTDNFQIDRSTNSDILVKANYIHITSPDCATQALSWYDCCTSKVTVEDNVIDIRRPWGIEVYSDIDSIIRHNTIVWHPANECDFNVQCGKVIADSKTASGTGTGSDDPPGTGTQVYDNVITAIDLGRATVTQHHNMCRLTCSGTGTLNSTAPTFVGGGTFAGRCDYALAVGSPGKSAASDGLDMGIRGC